MKRRHFYSIRDPLEQLTPVRLLVQQGTDSQQKHFRGKKNVEGRHHVTDREDIFYITNQNKSNKLNIN